MNKLSYKVALGGIVTALCLLLMFATGAMPLLYLTLPMIAGALLMIINQEISPAWAALTYLAVSLLSLFVTFDKEAALIFILFFGHYPILKQYLDRLRPRVLRLGCKLGVFAVCAAADYYFTIYLLGLTEMAEDLADLRKWMLLGLGLVLLLIFLTYDYALSGFSMFYRRWFKPKILGRR